MFALKQGHELVHATDDEGRDKQEAKKKGDYKKEGNKKGAEAKS